MIPKNIPNKYNFFGTVISCGKNKNWETHASKLQINNRDEGEM